MQLFVGMWQYLTELSENHFSYTQVIASRSWEILNKYSETVTAILITSGETDLFPGILRDLFDAFELLNNVLQIADG